MLNEKALELIRKYNRNLRTFNKDVCEDILGTKYTYNETLVSDMFNELDMFEIEKSLKNDFEVDTDNFNLLLYLYEMFNKERLNIVKEWINNDYDIEILLDMIYSKIIYHKNILVCDTYLEDLSDYELISEIVDNGFSNLYYYDVSNVQIEYPLEDGLAIIDISNNGYDYNITLSITTDDNQTYTQLYCSLNELLENKFVLDTSNISEINENECIEYNGIEIYFN